MRAYARVKLPASDEHAWGLVGLMHDFDYERWPSLEDHPFRGVGDPGAAKGYPEWFRRAILSHADYSGVPRESQLEKSLFACDELCAASSPPAPWSPRPSRSTTSRSSRSRRR